MTDVDEAAPTPAGRRRGRKQAGAKKPMPLWQETILLLALALVLAIVIKSLFVQAFYIPSPSMEPQFVENDRILVQKVSYWGSGTRSAATSSSSRTRVAGSTPPTPRARPTRSRRSWSGSGSTRPVATS